MSYFMVDVEADGPCPGRYSMVSFGAILVKPGLDVTFHGRLKPVSESFDAAALAVSGVTRAETLAFPEPLRSEARRDFQTKLVRSRHSATICW